MGPVLTAAGTALAIGGAIQTARTVGRLMTTLWDVFKVPGFTSSVSQNIRTFASTSQLGKAAPQKQLAFDPEKLAKLMATASRPALEATPTMGLSTRLGVPIPTGPRPTGPRPGQG